MFVSKKLKAICLAAAVAALAGCQSAEIEPLPASGETTGATSVPETDNPAVGSEVTTTAVSVSQDITSTTIIDGESYVIGTTSGTPADITTVGTTSETTVKSTTASVKTTDTTSKPVETTGASSSVTAAGTTSAAVTANAPAKVNAEDIWLDLECSDSKITPDTKDLTLDMWYAGDDNAILYTGSSYELEKLVDGKWEDVPFADGISWTDVAYEVSEFSTASIDISFDSKLYKEEIEPGNYRVVKKLTSLSGDTVEVSAEFEVEERYKENTLVEENGFYTMTIDKIEKDRFVCSLVFPYPNVYYVICDTSEYPDLCVGDKIEVYFSEIYWLKDEYYRVIPKSITFSDYELDPDLDYKPVIYLYPGKTSDVTVKLDYNGTLTLTDPEYKDGWTVTAYPDGTLISEGREYPYLFWEGRRSYELDTSKGFCVSGVDTEEFLEEKLAYLGLNEKETADFMEFWLPYMEKAPYNVITFAGADYTDNAVLDITPSPDTVIRVYMTFTPSDEYVDIPEQQLEKAPERNGFTVVEWGGSTY